MAKRAANEGTIYQRKDGTWCAQFTANGKRRTVYGKSQQEARQKLLEAQAQIARGEYAEPSRLTLGEWLPFYVENISKISVRKSTYEKESRILKNNLLPFFADVRLQDKRLADRIQAFIKEQLEEDYASGTIHQQIVVLQKALKAAQARGYILRVPTIAQPKQEQEEVHALLEDELTRLRAVLPDNTAGRAIRFVTYTGLRVGELLALRWTDIDDVLHVRQTLTDSGDIQPPKTNAGRREIPLSAKARDILSAQKRAQAAERLRAGSAWQDSGLVFATSAGTPNDRHNIGRVLRSACKRAGLAEIGIHTLRHTFITHLVLNGADIRTVSELAGHTSVAFTLQRYAHSNIQQKQAAVEKLS